MTDEAPASGAPLARGFVCDEMLGKLARSLRLLGFDVLYARGAADDSEVAALARREGRILLTRDVELAGRVRDALLVASLDPADQLREVLAAYGLAPDPGRALTRCSLCNTTLQPLTEAEARGRVPPGVLERHREFWGCSTCGRVYWSGTHVAAMGERFGFTRGGDESSG